MRLWKSRPSGKLLQAVVTPYNGEFSRPTGEFMFRLFKNKEAVKKYLLFFFLLIVSLGMVITLAPIPGGDIGRADNSVLADIDGNTITTMDLRRVIDQQLRNSPYGYKPQMVAAMATPLLDDMVLRRALRAQAEKLGIEVTDREVQQAAQAVPGLYENGAFIGRERFEQLANTTLEQFISDMRERLLKEKMRSVITDGVRVTPPEVREEFLRRNARARIEYVPFDPGQFLKAVQVTPQALEGFFKKNPDRYKLPEQRRIRYILVDADRVRAQAKMGEDELRRYYEDHRSDYRVPERVKVAHIFFKTTEKSPAEVASVETIARDVLGQVRSGKDFGELARKYSEDSTAAQGGDLGWIVRGQTVKEFEDAAFTMKPGQVSDLIKTIYGIHILKVLDKQAAHLQTFDEIRESIRAALERQKLETAQQALADDLARQLKANPQGFEATARKAGFEPKETPLIRYNQVVPDFGKSESFSSLSFQLLQGEVGTPVSVPKGLGIIQVVEIVPEHTPRLEEVRDRVEEDYRAGQSRVVAAEKAREFAAQAKSGEFKAAARKLSLTVKESKDFARQDYVEGVGPGTALAAAFSLGPGATSDVVTVGGTSVVFRVVAQTPANEADLAFQKDQIAEEILAQKRNLAFEVYKQNLKQQLQASGKLKMNAAAMSQFLATYQRQ